MRWDHNALLALAALTLAVLMAAPTAGSEPSSIAPPGEFRKHVGDSFLFSRRAQNLIEAARLAMPVAHSGAPKRAAAIEPHQATDVLHLSAIVYHDPADWRIWLNGRRFTPSSRGGAIELVEVGPDAVWLLWRGQGQPAAPVQLRPNQSYIIESDMIVEGRVEPTLTQSQGRAPAISN